MGAESAPVAAPVDRELVRIGQDSGQVAAVVVFVPEPRRTGAEAADPGVDFARCRKPAAAKVVSRGRSFAFVAGPAARADQHVQSADQVHRAARVGDLPGESPRAETDALERAAGVIGQHLSYGM